MISSRYDTVSSLFKTPCHSENNSRDFTLCTRPSIAALHVRRVINWVMDADVAGSTLSEHLSEV